MAWQFPYPGMDYTIPQFAFDDMKALQKADKTRRTRLRNGTMSHKSFYASIKKDLHTSATDGRIHRYVLCLAMYRETIEEVQGKPYFNRLVERANVQLGIYLMQMHNFNARVPFAIPDR